MVHPVCMRNHGRWPLRRPGLDVAHTFFEAEVSGIRWEYIIQKCWSVFVLTISCSFESCNLLWNSPQTSAAFATVRCTNVDLFSGRRLSLRWELEKATVPLFRAVL